jgi:hypothetical protein
MDPFTVHAYISTSREEVFDLISELAVRESFAGRYMRDFRLTHPKSQGVGAAARYLVPAPLNHHYVETQIVEAERPLRVTEATHGGRGGRSHGEMRWEVSRATSSVTEVELTVVWEPATPRERVKERLGTRGWMRRRAKRSLEQLRAILEESPRRPLPRSTIAGYEPLKAPRFGLSLPAARR